MSESVMPKYISHKRFGQTPISRGDLFTSQERMDQVDNAVREQTNESATPSVEAINELTPREEAMVQEASHKLEKVQFVDDLEHMGFLLEKERDGADKYMESKK